MSLNVNSLNAFKQALNMMPDGKFKTDSAHTKGELYLEPEVSDLIATVNCHSRHLIS